MKEIYIYIEIKKRYVIFLILLILIPSLFILINASSDNNDKDYSYFGHSFKGIDLKESHVTMKSNLTVTGDIKINKKLIATEGWNDNYVSDSKKLPSLECVTISGPLKRKNTIYVQGIANCEDLEGNGWKLTGGGCKFNKNTGHRLINQNHPITSFWGEPVKWWFCKSFLTDFDEYDEGETIPLVYAYARCCRII